ncbi:MAG TPA: peptidase [Streptosporangiaceae bacterium]|nr:peptidase [Streptosporangiaceae bacterium]
MRCPLSALVLLVAGVLAPATSALAAPAHHPAGPAQPSAGPAHSPAAPAHAAAGAGAGASFGIRLVDVPGFSANDPRALRYITDHLPPGAVIRRRVLVENESQSVAHVALYADAATISRGSFVGDNGGTRSELTTWIGASRQELTLAPHKSAMDAVTIRVPRDASSGERYGVIWAQETSTVPAGNGIDIREVNRVGIRIYLSIGPGGAPPTNFTITHITGSRQQNGDPVVAARLTNTGGRAVDLSGYLTLTDGPGGVSAGPFAIPDGVITLAPGQSGQARAILPKRLPDGPWRVTIDMKSGLIERRASATIDFAAAHSRLLWWLLAAILVLLAALLAVYLWHRRRRRSGPPSDMPAESGVPVG